MKLYHGTSTKYLDRILREGLKSRGRKSGNWKHTMLSRPDSVYLTAAYALHYAKCAIKKEDALILEIDTAKLNPFRFYPDEDFMEQATRKHPDYAEVQGDMAARTIWFRDRLPEFRHLWEKSIEHLGNCCYGGMIPPEAITRYAIVPPEHNALLWWCDPTIILLNYMIMSNYYKDLTARVFGDEVVESEEPTEPTVFKVPPKEGFEGIKVHNFCQVSA